MPVSPVLLLVSVAVTAPVGLERRALSWSHVSVCMCVCLFACLYVVMVCMSVCMCVRMSVCLYSCMLVDIAIRVCVPRNTCVCLSLSNCSSVSVPVHLCRGVRVSVVDPPLTDSASTP